MLGTFAKISSSNSSFGKIGEKHTPLHKKLVTFYCLAAIHFYSL
jgi:hypothetical protein